MGAAVRPENPKDAMGAKKRRVWLVPPASIAMQADAAGEGADKYGAYNYRDNEVKASVYVGAILRHALAYASGQDIDPKSGKPHIGHILASAGIVADATVHGNLVDDRAASPAAAALFVD